jgi:hypothetical protein
MLKRIADLLEKVSAGSFLVALYQSSTQAEGYMAFVFGLCMAGASLYLTLRSAK